jgi:acetyl esterase
VAALGLHPQAAELLRQAASSTRPNAHLLPVKEARRYFDEECAAAEVGEPVKTIVELAIPVSGDTIPLRLYRPEAGRLPVAVYLHGGGWVLGSIDSHDAACRALANASSTVVVSVGYRLAPEHPFPAAVEDAYSATSWLARHGADLDIDTSVLAVAGDSAGGNLAAAVTLLARDRQEIDIAFQLLVYPVTTTDLDRGCDDQYDGIILQREELQWHQDNYLADASDGRSPLVSPLDHADLHGLPPAMIITAGCDPLHPQGELYADALRDAGVPTEHLHYDGMVHGFFQMPATLDDARDAIERAGAALSASLRRRAPWRPAGTARS